MVGGTITLEATVSNVGKGPAAATTLRFLQSTDTIIDILDFSLLAVAVESLAENASTEKWVDLHIRTAATFYFGACVNPLGNESDKTDNCSNATQVIGTVPDPVGEWGAGNTYAAYTFPDSVYSRLEWTMLPVRDPPESLMEKGLLHYYAMNWFGNDAAGYAGFQSNGSIGHRRLNRKVVNFAIWGAEPANTDGMINPHNEECGCEQIMYPYEYEEEKPYRFVLDTGPSGEGDDHRWWGLWVTDVEADSTVFIGETRSERKVLNFRETPLVAWAEDSHFWHTLNGLKAYECEDFEPSSLAVLDVEADGVSPAGVHAYTNGGETATGSNGHETTLCDDPSIYSRGLAVQHNLGYSETEPENILERLGSGG